MHSENPPDRTKVSCNSTNYQSLVVTAELLCLAQERRRREDTRKKNAGGGCWRGGGLCQPGDRINNGHRRESILVLTTTPQQQYNNTNIHNPTWPVGILKARPLSRLQQRRNHPTLM